MIESVREIFLDVCWFDIILFKHSYFFIWAQETYSWCFNELDEKEKVFNSQRSKRKLKEPRQTERSLWRANKGTVINRNVTRRIRLISKCSVCDLLLSSQIFWFCSNHNSDKMDLIPLTPKRWAWEDKDGPWRIRNGLLLKSFKKTQWILDIFWTGQCIRISLMGICWWVCQNWEVLQKWIAELPSRGWSKFWPSLFSRVHLLDRKEREVLKFWLCQCNY